MNKTRPVYWYVLAVAVVIYVIGVCLIQTDLYMKVGDLEHVAVHASSEPGHACAFPVKGIAEPSEAEGK